MSPLDVTLTFPVSNTTARQRSPATSMCPTTPISIHHPLSRNSCCGEVAGVIVSGSLTEILAVLSVTHPFPSDTE